MPEPNGCSSYFFGLPIPEGVGLFCLFRANLFGNHQYCYEKLDPSSQGAYRVWVEDNRGPIESNEPVSRGAGASSSLDFMCLSVKLEH